MQSERIAKNGAAGNCAQIPIGVHATEKDVGIEDTQVADHRESHESLTAGANAETQNWQDEAMGVRISTPEKYRPQSRRQTRRGGNAGFSPGKTVCASLLTIAKSTGIAMSLATTSKLGMWVANQRRYYRLQLYGISIVYDALPYPSIGKPRFRMRFCVTIWEDRLSELADYRKIHGNAMFLKTTAKGLSWLLGSQPK